MPGAIQAQAAAPRAIEPADDRPLWQRYRPSFAIVVAFCAGMFVMGLAFSLPPVATTLLVVGLFGTSLGFSRFFTRALVRRQARRARSSGRAS